MKSSEEQLDDILYYSSSDEEDEEEIESPLLVRPSLAKRQKKLGTLGGLTLVVAMLIASSKDAVFKSIFANHPNFTACNVLCGSNLIGLLTLPLVFRKDLTMARLRSINRKQWIVLAVATVFYSVLGPMLYLMGLQMSSVVDAAILSRLESLEFLFVSTIFLSEKVDRWAFINAIIILAGVLANFLYPDPLSASFTTGQIYIVLGGFCFVASLLLTKKYLSSVPVGILGIFRVAAGTVIYHAQAVINETANRKGYFQQNMWKHLWWYALLYVTVFQAVWLFALQNAKSIHISLGTTCLFLLSIGWAGLIIPKDVELSDAQQICVGTITLGVLSGLARALSVGDRRRGVDKEEKKRMLVKESEGVGARGVI